MPFYVNPQLIHQEAAKDNAQQRMADSSNNVPSLSAASPRGKLYRAGQAATVAADGLDEASTLSNLSTGGFKEDNPIMGDNPYQNLGLKSGFVAGKLLLMKKLADSGHDKLAGALGLVSAAAPAWAGYHNLRIRNQ